MVLIGTSQGLTLSPLTSAGVSGVSHQSAGAASGAVNVAHQIGSSVGLAVLVAVSGLGGLALSGRELMAFRVRSAFEAGTVMLVLASLIIVFAIVLPGRKNGGAPPRQETDKEIAEEAGLYANEVP